MAADRLRFRRERRFVGSGVQRRVGVMGLLLVVCAGLFAARTFLLPPTPTPAPAPPVVEVVGTVPRPGFYEAGSLHEALAAAGVADPSAHADATLREGTRIVVEDGIRLERMDDVLVVGLPISVNTASARALEAIPGVGPTTAAAIVADREARGPFASVEDLDRVKGIGPATVEKLRPFVVVEAP